MDLPKVFIQLNELFSKNGYSLYLVGGTSRDFLLNKELTDFDFATDATLEEMKSFLEVKETFSKLGSMSIRFNGIKCDITTLRIEEEYLDYRHPNKIKFVKDIKLDSYRRDFSINALYVDSEGKVFDFHNGLNDLNNKIIKMIGDSSIRLKEDPLRILRGIRFSKLLDFNIDSNLKENMKKNASLLKKLSFNKVNQELNKLAKIDKNINETLLEYNIDIPVRDCLDKERYVVFSNDNYLFNYQNNVYVQIVNEDINIDEYYLTKTNDFVNLEKSINKGYLVLFKINVQEYNLLKEKYQNYDKIPYTIIRKDLKNLK